MADQVMKMREKHADAPILAIKNHWKDADTRGYALPAKIYLYVALLSRFLLATRPFQAFSILMVTWACVAIGVSQSEWGRNNDAFSNAVDISVASFFCFEIGIRIIAEGLTPHKFILKSRKPLVIDYWAIIDTVIVIVSFLRTPEVAVLRLLRLMRILRLVRWLTALQILIRALYYSLANVVSIICLELLIFFVFGIIGVGFFRDQDPEHFGSLGQGFATLFQLSTLDDWGRIMMGLIFTNCADNSSYPDCLEDDSSALSIVIYFFFFVFLSSMVVLNLIVGVVAGHMKDSSVYEEESAQEPNEENKSAGETTPTSRNQSFASRDLPTSTKKKSFDFTKFRKRLWIVLGMANNVTENPEKAEKFDKLLSSFKKLSREVELALASLEHMREAFCLEPVLDKNPTKTVADGNSIFFKICNVCRRITENKLFEAFSLGIVFLCALLLAIEVEMSDANDSVQRLFSNLEWVISAMFLFELVVKILSFGLEPKKFWFNNGTIQWWNSLDTLITALCMADLQGAGILRMLRLLRVLRVVRMFESMRNMVDILFQSIASISWVVCLLFLFIYIFSIAGMVFFSDNDFVHFGTLQRTILSLVYASTGDMWSELMFLNMSGCKDQTLYYYPLKWCTDPKGQPYLSVIFFSAFVFISSISILNLMVGIICIKHATVAHRNNFLKKRDVFLGKLQKLLALSNENKGNIYEKIQEEEMTVENFDIAKMQERVTALTLEMGKILRDSIVHEIRTSGFMGTDSKTVSFFSNVLEKPKRIPSADRLDPMNNRRKKELVPERNEILFQNLRSEYISPLFELYRQRDEIIGRVSVPTPLDATELDPLSFGLSPNNLNSSRVSSVVDRAISDLVSDSLAFPVSPYLSRGRHTQSNTSPPTLAPAPSSPINFFPPTPLNNSSNLFPGKSSVFGTIPLPPLDPSTFIGPDSAETTANFPPKIFGSGGGGSVGAGVGILASQPAYPQTGKINSGGETAEGPAHAQTTQTTITTTTIVYPKQPFSAPSALDDPQNFAGVSSRPRPPPVAVEPLSDLLDMAEEPTVADVLPSMPRKQSPPKFTPGTSSRRPSAVLAPSPSPSPFFFKSTTLPISSSSPTPAPAPSLFSPAASPAPKKWREIPLRASGYFDLSESDAPSAEISSRNFRSQTGGLPLNILPTSGGQAALGRKLVPGIISPTALVSLPKRSTTGTLWVTAKPGPKQSLGLNSKDLSRQQSNVEATHVSAEMPFRFRNSDVRSGASGIWSATSSGIRSGGFATVDELVENSVSDVGDGNSEFGRGVAIDLSSTRMRRLRD